MLIFFLVWLSMVLYWVADIGWLTWQHWVIILPATIFFVYFQYMTEIGKDKEEIEKGGQE